MTSTPTVSVVMPAYNAERFLAEAMDSILGQTHSDLEFIIVDDCSTDSTPQLLETYSRRDARVQVVRNDVNQGVTRSRNAGCRVARGSFIAVMDADDVSLPNRLQRQLEYFERHPDIWAVGAWVRKFDAEGRLLDIHYNETHPALVSWAMPFHNSVSHPTTMFRRTAIDLSAVYNVAYPVAEDYAVLFDLSCARRVANLPEVLLHYRTWAGNITKRSSIDQHANRVVRDVLARFDVNLSESDVEALQGLSRDRYPSSDSEIRRVGEVISTLRAVFVSRVATNAADVHLINTSAGVRLWLLAVLAAKRSPWTALALMRRALSTAPGSVFPFTAKVVRRLLNLPAARPES